MHAVIGGLGLRLIGAHLERFVAGLGPFVRPLGAAHLPAFVLRVGRPRDPRPPVRRRADFLRRHVALWFDPSGAEVRWDGSRAGFEAALQVALQRGVAAQGGLLVHAAAGVRGGRGWLMPGVSGTGKSTAARVAGFDRVLSDEMVVLRPGSDGWRVFGTPFWSQGSRRPLSADSAPLDTVVLLEQGPALHAEPARPDEVAAHLLRSVVLYEPDERTARRAFERSCDVALAARGLRLWFAQEGSWKTVLSR